jgi:hypothetical protein
VRAQPVRQVQVEHRARLAVQLFDALGDTGDGADAVAEPNEDERHRLARRAIVFNDQDTAFGRRAAVVGQSASDG